MIIIWAENFWGCNQLESHPLTERIDEESISQLYAKSHLIG